MKIMVCGCGKIGAAIIESLAAEGHDLIAVDRDPAAVREIAAVCDVIGVEGNCADCETLDEAGVREVGLFIAVTGSDEVNMLSCFLAGSMGAEHTIARIRNPEYNDDSLGFMRDKLGLSMAINPEQLAARELFDLLKLPSAAKIEPFAGRAFEAVEMKLRENSPLDNVSLRELREKYKTKILVSMVQRGDEVHIPDGSFVLRAGDRVGMIASPAEIGRFLTKAGLMQKSAKQVMILGGSRTAFYLTKLLTDSGCVVKVVEKERDTADAFSAELDNSGGGNAVVICGDGTSQELLLEEGINTTDAFVALTGMDEENILMSIYALGQKTPKVIAKVNRPELSSLAEKLGLDCLVSPKNIIADTLVRYARALENSSGESVETMYKLMDGEVEAIEFSVKREIDGVTSVPLRELTLKPGILVAGIIRKRRSIVPGGEDKILPGDRVITIAAGMRLHSLGDIRG